MSYSGERDNFAPHMALVPMVIEQTSRGERSFDIYSRLLLSLIHISEPTRPSHISRMPSSA